VTQPERLASRYQVVFPSTLWPLTLHRMLISAPEGYRPSFSDSVVGRARILRPASAVTVPRMADPDPFPRGCVATAYDGRTLAGF